VFQRSLIIKYLPLLPNGYSASITSTMVLIERGYAPTFHPVTMAKRHGHSKVKFGDGVIAVILVMRTVMLFGPMRVFLGSGLLLVGVGATYGLVLAVRNGLGVPVGAVVLLLTGALLVVVGLVADQVSQLRLSLYDEVPFQVIRGRTDPPHTQDSGT